MSAEFDPESAFLDCADPLKWAYTASALQKAASLMDWTKNRDITDWRYVPIYRMLMGFSLENLLKGILVAEGHAAIVNKKLNPALGNHGLKTLADKVTGLKITKLEKRLLRDLEEYVLWAGRYPAPKQLTGVVRIGHSRSARNAELALAQKLYDYLRTRCPEIESIHIAYDLADG
jgi:hypothetical protein